MSTSTSTCAAISPLSILRVRDEGAVWTAGASDSGKHELVRTLAKGTLIQVDWARSSSLMLWARETGVDGQAEGYGWVGSAHVEPVSALLPTETPGQYHAHSASNEHILVVESSSQSAPILESGLGSFAWPLSKEQFLATVWTRRAFAVLGSGLRLRDLRTTLLDFEVFRLLDIATTIVAWMRARNGDLQHIAVDATTAKQCYLAGHSLNFNLPPPIQKAFVKPLCRDLGVDFAMELEGSIGGDVEMFACRSRHVTGWHFDGQDNFTVQLVGSKRWSVCPGVPFPVGNVNMVAPSGRDYAKYVEQKRIQASYAPESPVPPPVHSDKVQTVTLRPGSVLYFPSGCWHYVEAEEDTGSLSINVSLYPSSWMDVIVRSAVVHHLRNWEHWRRFIRVSDPEDARRQVRERLEALPRELASLRPEDVLPDGLFLGKKHKSAVRIGLPSEDCDDGGSNGGRRREASSVSQAVKRRRTGDSDPHILLEWSDEEEAEPPSGLLRRNPISVLVCENLDEPRWHAVESHRKAKRSAAEAALVQRLATVVQTGSIAQPVEASKMEPSAEESELGPVVGEDEPLRCAVHTNFGNAELRPAVSEALELPRSWAPLVRWLGDLKPAGTVEAKSFFDLAGSVGATFQDATLLLRALQHGGYLGPD